MTIKLKPEQGRIIQEQIESGHFKTVDEVLDHALASLQGRQPKRILPRKNLAQFLMESPLAGYLERRKDDGRPIDL